MVKNRATVLYKELNGQFYYEKLNIYFTDQRKGAYLRGSSVGSAGMGKFMGLCKIPGLTRTYCIGRPYSSNVYLMIPFKIHFSWLFLSSASSREFWLEDFAYWVERFLGTFETDAVNEKVVDAI